MLRRGDLDRRAFEQNVAVILLIQAVENVHQRGFARAVFAEQAMNFAALRLEIHMIIG